MASLRVFSLEGKGLKLDNAEDIDPHIQALKDDPDIEEVHFLGNTLGVGACEALSHVLASKEKLQVANFADIFTTRLLSEIPPALDALLTALLALPHLHTVNLSDNAFGFNTRAPLVSFLSAHTPLEHLILNNNGMGPIAGEYIADALTALAEKKVAANAPPLQTVICGRNRLENGSMAAWAKAYAAHTGVKTVRMVQNGIRQEGITHMLKSGLKHARGLRILDLEDNTFTAMGARALSDNVGGWTELKELCLGDCYLSTRGGVMLGEALSGGKNAQLEVLKLPFNNFDSKAIKSLADAQSALPKVRRVELNGNKFSEEDVSIERIREALDTRREEAGVEVEDDDNQWGLDELDELESEDEDEEEEQADEEDEEREIELKRSDEAEAENVTQKKDVSVDELADALGKTELK